ncbi:MAG: branched-chain amino acid ABC transporter permease [Deltaproteobacteria bacterium]|nr:branched-chain amino acid ABC transporter permease [Deltaproteobacteria bacterium]
MRGLKRSSFFLMAAGAALAVGIPLLPSYAVTLASSILIYGIYVCSANLLTGYTGLVSLGQAMFWGSAAYMVAILTTRGIVTNFYVVALIALAAVLVLSAFFGVLALRVKRLYFMIVTFAFGHVVWSIAMYPAQHLTFGYDGIRGIARPRLAPFLDTAGTTAFYYFVLTVAVVCFGFLYRLVNSPFGHAIAGIRDNEHRMAALGYNTFVYKYISYNLSALLAGVGGILYACFTGYVNPSELHWLWSGDAMMMMFIGGIGSFWGPLWGALAYTGLRYWISSYTMYWFGIEGIIFILVVLFFRGGIVGFLRTLSVRIRGGGSAEGAPAANPAPAGEPAAGRLVLEASEDLPWKP